MKGAPKMEKSKKKQNYQTKFALVVAGEVDG